MDGFLLHILCAQGDLVVFAIITNYFDYLAVVDLILMVC
jgi:hypothetical protein